MPAAWLALGCWVGLIGSARGDDLTPLQGTWEGAIRVSPTVELATILHVEIPRQGPARVTVDSPNQGVRGIQVDKLTLNQGAVTFEVPTTGASFRGTLDPGGRNLKGDWSQRGQTLPLELTRVDDRERPTEVWEGALELPNSLKLRIVFRIRTEPDDTLRAVMDSPDQGASDIKVDTVEKRDRQLKFTVDLVQGAYTGKLNEAGTEAVGEWKQAGAALPLTLKKVAKPTELKRPQEPKTPFPYEVQEVRYDNPAAKISLAGTLTTPKGTGPFPAALLITGSGPQDRDESLLGHKPFLVLADALTRQGIAVLRVDDRGVNGSTGKFSEATSEDFASDVEAGVAFLKSRPGIDPRAIGLIGHSEGGIIAPLVATRSDDVAWIVLMAGTGLPGAEILEMQSALIMKAGGASERDIQIQREAVRKLTGIVRDQPDNDKAREAIKAEIRELLESLPEDRRKTIGEGKGLDAQADQLTSPWFRYFLTFDPRPTLRQVRCPVLAIIGEKDLQVPCRENLAEIETALKAGGNSRVTVRELPGLNHLFQACATGSPSEYGTIEETINPVALQLIGDWILQITGADRR
jgi:hypothetical protein